MAATSLKSILTVPDISCGGAPAIKATFFLGFFAASLLSGDEPCDPTSWGMGRNLQSHRHPTLAQYARSSSIEIHKTLPLSLGALFCGDDVSVEHHERRNGLDDLQPVVLLLLQWISKEIEVLQVAEFAQNCQ